MANLPTAEFTGTARRYRNHGLPVWRTQPGQLVIFSALAVVLGIMCLLLPRWMPFTSFAIVLMVGGFFLRVRRLVVLIVLVAAVMLFVSVNRTYAPTQGEYVIVAIAAALVTVYAKNREELGVQGTTGDSMLVDLRDRLVAQGQIPTLPVQWHVESDLSAAYGDSFSGDLLVATKGDDTLELALVDVSGKGQRAGTRALLLSGAFGGLLGAMPPEDFLPAANSYLLRQEWDEGFATAIHLYVDLRSGYFELANAGHPPAAHFHAGSGLWQMLGPEHGPALGIIGDVDFPSHRGELLPGDALLLYTDGLVEFPGTDVGFGIDRLMGEAERQVTLGDFRGGARRIMQAIGANESDDRALVLLWRQAPPTTRQ